MKTAHAAELAHALFDDSNDALFVLDRNVGSFVDANVAGERLSGVDRGTLLKSSIFELLKPRNVEIQLEIEQALQARKHYHSPDGVYLATNAREKIQVELTLRSLGNGPRVLVKVKDVRLVRALEARAATAEAELSLLLQTVPAAAWSAEPEGEGQALGGHFASWRFRYLSSAVERVTGWPINYFFDGMHRFIEIIHPDDRTPMSTEYAACLLSPQPFFTMETRLIGPKGDERWVRAEMQIRRNPQGRATRIDGVITDISRPKLAEMSLQESQQWLTRLLETSANAIFILDLAGRISFLNPAAEKLIGLRAEELLDRDWNELPWRSEASDDNNNQEITFLTQRSSELILDRSDQKAVTVWLSAAPMRDDAGRVTGVVITLQDITQHKRAEEALRASEERLSQIVEAVTDGLLLVDKNKRITFANEATERIFRASRQELQSRSWDELPWMSIGDGVDAKDIVSETLEEGESLVGIPLSLLPTNAPMRTVLASFSPLRDGRHGITGMIVSLTQAATPTEASIPSLEHAFEPPPLNTHKPSPKKPKPKGKRLPNSEVTPVK